MSEKTAFQTYASLQNIRCKKKPLKNNKNAMRNNFVNRSAWWGAADCWPRRHLGLSYQCTTAPPSKRSSWSCPESKDNTRNHRRSWTSRIISAWWVRTLEQPRFPQILFLLVHCILHVFLVSRGFSRKFDVHEFGTLHSVRRNHLEGKRDSSITSVVYTVTHSNTVCYHTVCYHAEKKILEDSFMRQSLSTKISFISCKWIFKFLFSVHLFEYSSTQSSWLFFFQFLDFCNLRLR